MCVPCRAGAQSLAAFIITGRNSRVQTFPGPQDLCLPSSLPMWLWNFQGNKQAANSLLKVLAAPFSLGLSGPPQPHLLQLDL